MALRSGFPPGGIQGSVGGGGTDAGYMQGKHPPCSGLRVSSWWHVLGTQLLPVLPDTGGRVVLTLGCHLLSAPLPASGDSCDPSFSLPLWGRTSYRSPAPASDCPPNRPCLFSISLGPCPRPHHPATLPLGPPRLPCSRQQDAQEKCACVSVPAPPLPTQRAWPCSPHSGGRTPRPTQGVFVLPGQEGFPSDYS